MADAFGILGIGALLVLIICGVQAVQLWKDGRPPKPKRRDHYGNILD